MQKLINELTLVIFVLFSIFYNWSCRKPLDIDECQEYLSYTATGVVDSGTGELYPGCKMARFTTSEEPTIVFVQETKNKSRVMKRSLDRGGNKKIFESEEKIQTFDYSTTGDIAFTHDWGLYLVEKGDEEAIEIPFFINLGYVKWRGDKMVCQAGQGLLYEIDKQGNQTSQWDLQTIATDYWASDSTLIVGNKDSITVLSLPDLAFQWSLPTSEYFDDLGNVIYETRHIISVVGKYSPEQGLTEVFFSTPDQVYNYHLESKVVTSIWQQQECLIVEPGISISPDGNYVIVTVSTQYKSPMLHKRFGVMKIGLDGEWEVIEPWNRGS
jgi:hypothetical protein